MADIIANDDERDDEKLAALRALGRVPDEDIDLAEAALLFAALDHPGITLERYRHHLTTLAENARTCFEELRANGGTDDAETRLAALRVTIFSDEGYTGDEKDYNNLDNADMIRVIDRRKGMPIALAILYIHAARAQGWTLHGLNMPGHFLARIDCGPQRLIFDPFHGGKIMTAADLRAQLKAVMGAQAELSADYYNPTPNREIIVRLQNNRKIRLIEGEDYEGALAVVTALRAFAPDEYRLLLDEGVLCARTDRNQAAIRALEAYIGQAPGADDRHDAALLLDEIKRHLN